MASHRGQEGQPDLSDPTVREGLLRTHPLVTHKYTMLTPVIKETYESIRERVYLRRTGTFSYAFPRTGKTRCARAIKSFLSEEFDSSFVLFLPAEKCSNRTAFAHMLLRSCNLPVLKGERFEFMRDRFEIHVRSELERAKGDHFVLIIDEMQLLGEDEYSELCALHNRLDQADVAMTTIGFAQPEILEVREALQISKSFQLIARFLSEPIVFHGCRQEEDLSEILNSFDDGEDYPEGSGWSFCRFCVPRAFDGGFRVASYSNLVWSSLKEVAALPHGATFPMEHVFRTIEFLLLSLRQKDKPGLRLSPEEVGLAVEASNLAAFTRAVGSSDGP